jgi:hypothetical protein
MWFNLLPFARFLRQVLSPSHLGPIHRNGELASKHHVVFHSSELCAGYRHSFASQLEAGEICCLEAPNPNHGIVNIADGSVRTFIDPLLVGHSHQSVAGDVKDKAHFLVLSVSTQSRT